MYDDVELGDPAHEDLPEETQIRLEASDFEANSVSREDNRYELLEIYCEADIPGHEHIDPTTGKPTGIELPYIITVEKHSTKILSIYRGWKEQDPLQRRRNIFTKYDYLPGDGFYGYGLLHMIGGLQEAATGALRLIIDGAATSSLQGGFITKDASLKDENLVVEPGVWKIVDATAEDLNKAFFTPPFKEPSTVLFQIMGFLVTRAEKFAATTEMQTGTENSKNMPVGSTVAMMEAGSKVFSTIHKGMHKSLGEELRLRFELTHENMPNGGYPFDVEGAHEGLFAEDFVPGVSIQPVSDPNIFSTAQRVAQNQAVYDLAMQNPDLMRKEKALRRVLEGLKVPDLDELMIDTTPPPPRDVVSEVACMLRGEAVQAYPDQDHNAHLQSLWAFANNPQYGANPQVMQAVGPVLQGLIGQHLAYAWVAENRKMGAPAAMPPPVMGAPQQEGSPEGAEPGQPAAAVPTDAPPEVISAMAAEIAPMLVRAPGLPPPAAPGEASDQAKASAIEQESQAKLAAGQQNMAIEAMQAQQKMDTERMLAQIKADAQVQMAEIKAETARAAAETQNQIAQFKAQIMAQTAQHGMQTSDRKLQSQMMTDENNRGIAQDQNMRAGAQQAIDAELQTAQVAHGMDISERESAVNQEATRMNAAASAKAKAAPKPKAKKGA
jgi:hypothetical protein